MLHAVLVGVNSFQDSAIAPLSYARADAEALAELLRSRIREEDRDVRVLVDADATKGKIMELIAEELPRSMSDGDAALLYFACHGSPEAGGHRDATSLYLVVHDTKYDRIFSTGIEMASELPTWIGRMRRASLVLVALDCCFSGGAGGRTFEGPALRRSPGRRLIFSAADDDQVAAESDARRHGIFTHHLLSELSRPASGEPTISVFELYQRVARAVKEETRGAQVPVLNGRGALPSLPRLG
jgi:uncharacterized caspase-like protein